MTENVKKISFGFSKLSKQSLATKSKKIDHESSIQYIDCLESKSIKVKGNPIKTDKPELVIPVRNNKCLTDNCDSSTSNSKVLIKSENNDVSEYKGDKLDLGIPESLDIIAAREIIEDLKQENSTEEKNVLTLPLTGTEGKASLEKEPTPEDYESIPVTDFGMAMLRGMGWNPGKGIGKSEKVVPTSSVPVLRPKGMGLGADKLVSAPIAKNVNSEEEELKVIKGAFVKVIAGAHKDSYGQVEGFNEDEGRIIIKSALGKSSISVIECMVKPVSEEEYKRHSRVLNLSKYEEQKRKERKHEKSYSVTHNSNQKRSRLD